MSRSRGLLVSLAVLGVAWPRPARASSHAGDHLDSTERARVDAAIGRGSAWLLSRQDAHGAFAPLVRTAVSDVAMTAIALWALESSAAAPQDRARTAARFLLGHRQPDGGIYDPVRGLAVYTSGVASQALRALRSPDPEIAGALGDVELFVYRRGIPESVVDLAQEPSLPVARVGADAARILGKTKDLNPEQRSALEFLSRNLADPGTRPPVRTRNPLWARPGPELGPFSYEDVLPFVYRPLEPDHQIVLRAHEALRARYDLERNPDLTRRYGEAGFQPGTQGLYYYYLLVARALSVRGTPWLETRDGARHDWVRELSQKITSLQKPDGRWVNVDGTWWEDEPVLVTSYALLTLSLCRDVPSDATPR